MLQVWLPEWFQHRFELILEEVSDNQQVFVELSDLSRVMEEIVVLGLCRWHQVLIVQEL